MVVKNTLRLILPILLAAVPTVWSESFIRHPATATRKLSTLPRDEELIDCDEFFGHFDTLAHVAGVRPPRSTKEYTRRSCERAFEPFKKNTQAVDAVINLSNHVKKYKGDRRRLARNQRVEDVASALRARRRLDKARETLSLELFNHQTPMGFDRFLQFNPFDSDNSEADEITECDPPDQDQCPHGPCVPFYLIDSDKYLSDADAPLDVYSEFNPGRYTGWKSLLISIHKKTKLCFVFLS